MSAVIGVAVSSFGLILAFAGLTLRLDYAGESRDLVPADLFVGLVCATGTFFVILAVDDLRGPWRRPMIALVLAGVVFALVSAGLIKLHHSQDVARGWTG